MRGRQIVMSTLQIIIDLKQADIDHPDEEQNSKTVVDNPLCRMPNHLLHRDEILWH